MKPAGFALLAGDASVVSRFREIHVPRAWHIYSVTAFDFPLKNRAGLGSIGAMTLPSASYLATILCRKDEVTHVMKPVRDTNSEPALPVQY